MICVQTCLQLGIRSDAASRLGAVAPREEVSRGEVSGLVAFEHNTATRQRFPYSVLRSVQNRDVLPAASRDGSTAVRNTE
jgi:hypothetical protein